VHGDRDVATAFELVTNPTRWARWHPATAAASSAQDRPLRPGGSVTEAVAAGGRRFAATGTVLASEPPRRCMIATATAAGDARIVYRLLSTPAGCRFARTGRRGAGATAIRRAGCWRAREAAGARARPTCAEEPYSRARNVSRTVRGSAG
jgi:uncharacterized protein YndB with AHSA1/START domain